VLGRGDAFGISTLRNDGGSYTATLIAKTATSCLRLKRARLQELADSKEGDILCQLAATSMVHSCRGETVSSQGDAGGGTTSGSDQRIERKELQRVGLLGCGGFGAVELWEHKTTGCTYAMKGVSLGYVVKTGMQESLMQEKFVLCLSSGSRFVVGFHTTFAGAQTAYFLMEACLGGELYSTYNRKGLHKSEAHARFYVANIALALQHLHGRRIVCRGIKPEDCVLDTKGYLKIVDMGLAKFVVQKTYTTCGTPDYFAPEVIASTGHGVGYDWWALGILAFELIAGKPPFEAPYPMRIYSQVMKGIGQVEFPAHLPRSGPCGSFVVALLERAVERRLPLRAGGFRGLQEHAFFTSLNWAALSEGRLEAPYLPTVKGPKDIGNFSARKEDMPKVVSFDGPREWLEEF